MSSPVIAFFVFGFATAFLPFRKLQFYEMEWEDIDLARYIVAVGPNAGPVGTAAFLISHVLHVGLWSFVFMRRVHACVRRCVFECFECFECFVFV